MANTRTAGHPGPLEPGWAGRETLTSRPGLTCPAGPPRTTARSWADGRSATGRRRVRRHPRRGWRQARTLGADVAGTGGGRCHAGQAGLLRRVALVVRVGLAAGYHGTGEVLGDAMVGRDVRLGQDLPGRRARAHHVARAADPDDAAAIAGERAPAAARAPADLDGPGKVPVRGEPDRLAVPGSGRAPDPARGGDQVPASTAGGQGGLVGNRVTGQVEDHQPERGRRSGA